MMCLASEKKGVEQCSLEQEMEERGKGCYAWHRKCAAESRNGKEHQCIATGIEWQDCVLRRKCKVKPREGKAGMSFYLKRKRKAMRGINMFGNGQAKSDAEMKRN